MGECKKLLYSTFKTLLGFCFLSPPSNRGQSVNKTIFADSYISKANAVVHLETSSSKSEAAVTADKRKL